MRDLEAGRRRGRRCVAIVSGGSSRAAHRRDDRLGQPVRGQHESKLSSALHPLDQRDRHDRRAGDREPQGGQVVAVARRMVEDRSGRSSARPGRTVIRSASISSHRASDVEDRLRHDGRAGEQAGDDAGLVAEAVEERVDHEVAVGGGRPRRTPPRRSATPIDLAVRAHHALAAAGRARGEQDVADVVRADCRGTRVRGLGGDRRARPPRSQSSAIDAIGRRATGSRPGSARSTRRSGRSVRPGRRSQLAPAGRRRGTGRRRRAPAARVRVRMSSASCPV